MKRMGLHIRVHVAKSYYPLDAGEFCILMSSAGFFVFVFLLNKLFIKNSFRNTIKNVKQFGSIKVSNSLDLD